MKYKLNGYYTRYLEKFLGLKGISFSLGWAAFWVGMIPWGWEFVVFILTLCGLKVSEDWFRLNSGKSNNH